MASERDLADQLRDRIVGGLHMGYLREGSRLAGIREVSRETGIDHRVVAKAYRLLEAEELVEVRGRSGVYVVPQRWLSGELMEETARWAAGVLVEAWRRRIEIPDFAEFIRRCTSKVDVRCACADSTEDHLTAFTTELEADFGLDAYPVRVLDATARGSGVPIVSDLHEELRGADLVVTTSYHAANVRPAAEELGIPMLTLTVHPDVIGMIERHLQDRDLTVVCVDPQFGERVRSIRGYAYRDRIHVVLANDEQAVGRIDAREPVLLTRAARERLGSTELTRLVPLSPSISPNSARELAEVIIRINAGAEET